jgi:hypothetical protein
MMIDALSPAALVHRVEAVAAEVRQRYGPEAFEPPTPEEVAVHEASHGVAAHCENIRAGWTEVFDRPVAGPAAGSGMPGVWFGSIKTRGLKWRADRRDPQLDLAEARFTLAGRTGELMIFGRRGAGLDELVLSEAITGVAARKLMVDARQLFLVEVRSKTKKILRTNWSIVDQIARQLLRDGYVPGRQLREILSNIRRLP